MTDDSSIYFHEVKAPPINTRIYLGGARLGDSGGDVVIYFHRAIPFNRLQVWCIKHFFGWRVEQDGR